VAAGPGRLMMTGRVELASPSSVSGAGEQRGGAEYTTCMVYQSYARARYHSVGWWWRLWLGSFSLANHEAAASKSRHMEAFVKMHATPRLLELA
jgi:hypothetical protein